MHLWKRHCGGQCILNSVLHVYYAVPVVRNKELLLVLSSYYMLYLHIAQGQHTAFLYAPDIRMSFNDRIN